MAKNTIYVAVLRKEKDSDWGVEFPDIPGCVSAGETMEDALAGAREALQGHIDTLHEFGETVPEPSTIPETVFLPSGPGETVTMGLIEVQPPSKTVRVNITIQDRLLHRMDEVAKFKGTTRSGLISQWVEMA